MKKFICIVLSLFMSLFFCACTHNVADNRNPQTENGSANAGGGNINFSVSLELNGEKFTQTSGMKAIWSNRQGVFTAEFDEESKANVTGPDGDYKVTVENLPAGYTYDPNIHYATNKNSQIVIPVYALNTYDETGEWIYAPDVIELKLEGAYRVELTDSSQIIYFQFAPREAGKYTIESMVDTTFNQVNPYVDVYRGTFAAKYFDSTYDTGGSSDTYTTNFLFSVQVYEDEIGNVFAFGVHATHKTNKFPVSVDFRIYKYDEHNRDGKTPDMKQPAHTFPDFTWDTGVWTWAEGNTKLFNGKQFALHTDGFYHIVENGVITDRKLYAMITTSIVYGYAGGEAIKRPFADYEGSTVGLSSFASGNLPSNPLQNIDGICYNEFIQQYAMHARNGVYPVTKELKDLLQAFAVGQRYFADGQGWFETQTGVFATEDDQWLFACGYYS